MVFLHGLHMADADQFQAQLHVSNDFTQIKSFLIDGYESSFFLWIPIFLADCFKVNSNFSSWDQAMERVCASLQSLVAKYFIFLSWSMFGFFIMHFTSLLISTTFSTSQFAGHSTCFNKSMISECGGRVCETSTRGMWQHGLELD